MANKDNCDDLVHEYKVTNFPSIILVKSHEKKPYYYDKKIGYQNLFDWLNIYSEQFVSGGSNIMQEDKPWLSESVPELNIKSANDICLGTQKTLCVVIFNKEKPGDEVIKAVKEVRREYQNNLGGRGFEYSFMWINSDTQTEWVEKFEITTTPSFVILNPGRRKRYIKEDTKLTYDTMFNQMEKISGGDARFKPLRPNETPQLV